jgi:hypothetical protein
LDDGAGVGVVTAAAKPVKNVLGQPRTIRVIYIRLRIGLVGGMHQPAHAQTKIHWKYCFAAESDFKIAEKNLSVRYSRLLKA